MIQRIGIPVKLKLHHKLLDGVDGEPDWRLIGVEAVREAEIFLPIAEEGREVLDGQQGGVLQEAVLVQQSQEFCRIALRNKEENVGNSTQPPDISYIKRNPFCYI